jgi:hypothetical protein
MAARLYRSLRKNRKQVRPFMAVCSCMIWLIYWANAAAAQAPRFLWARTTGGTSWDYGLDIALYGTNNYYLTGRFYSDAAFGSTTLTNTGNSDVFIAKYTMAGGLVWVRQIGGVGQEKANRLTLDGAGNCYVAGSYGGFDMSVYGSSFGSTNLPGRGGFIAKYDSQGQLQWARQSGNIANDVAVDLNGNCFVTGASRIMSWRDMEHCALHALAQGPQAETTPPSQSALPNRAPPE